MILVVLVVLLYSWYSCTRGTPVLVVLLYFVHLVLVYLVLVHLVLVHLVLVHLVHLVHIIHLVLVHLAGGSGDGGCHQLSQNIWFDRLTVVLQ